MSRTRNGFDIYRITNLVYGDKIQTRSRLCVGGYATMPEAADAVSKLYQIQANHNPAVVAAYNIQPCNHVKEDENYRENRADDRTNDKHKPSNEMDKLIDIFFYM